MNELYAVIYSPEKKTLYVHPIGYVIARNLLVVASKSPQIKAEIILACAGSEESAYQIAESDLMLWIKKLQRERTEYYDLLAEKAPSDNSDSGGTADEN